MKEQQNYYLWVGVSSADEHFLLNEGDPFNSTKKAHAFYKEDKESRGGHYIINTSDASWKDD